MDQHSTPRSGPDAATVTRDRRLSEWMRARAEIARLEAECAEILATALDSAMEEAGRITGGFEQREIPVRSMVAEFAAAVKLPPRTVEAMAFDAHHIVNDLPATHQALSDGEISLQHAREIAQVPLPADATAAKIAEFETAVLEKACFTTARRTRTIARALAQKVFPTDIGTAHRKARERRCVSVTDFDDGMSELTVHAPSIIAHAVLDRATQLAQHVQRMEEDAAARDSGSRRTLDQLRADLICDILLAGDPASIDKTAVESIRARVQVTIPARTLAGADEYDVAELDGVGLVGADLVRDLAGLAAGWDRLFVDTDHDVVVRTDRYRPAESMRRFLRARDQHCRFPGCRLPAERADIDHNRDHALGGPTDNENLAHFCRGHHTLKHPDLPQRHRWRVEQLACGVLQWTSPAGHIYIDEPPPRVVFA